MKFTLSTYDRFTGSKYDPFVEKIEELVEWPHVESILFEAERLINCERAKVYGQADFDFSSIGDLWSAYLTSRNGTSVAVSSADVGLMMVLLKVSRAGSNESHRDSLVDIAGYAGCVAKIRGIDQ